VGEAEGPLAAYFKHEPIVENEKFKKKAASGLFEANMYLAEDRILCFELVAKKKEDWILKYVSASRAVTDVPEGVAELISQRRRWLNGSLFAAIYALVNFPKLFRTSHSFGRLLLLLLETFYNFVNLIFSWFALANFYLAFFFLGNSAMSGIHKPFGDATSIIFEVTRDLYILALIIQFVLSLGNRPQGSKWIYTLTLVLFAIVMVENTYTAIFLVVRTIIDTNFSQGASTLLNNANFRDIVISLGATYGVYVVCSLIHLEPWHMITCFIQYMLLLPSFVNVLMVYALCNTHDVSWGTKGDNAPVKTEGPALVVKDNGQMFVTPNKASTEGGQDSNLDTEKQFNEALNRLRNPAKKEKEQKDLALKQEDHNRMFRTRIVLFWMLSNMLLVVLMTADWVGIINLSPGSVNPYLTFVFWSVAALSLFRFVGSVLYVLLKPFG